MNLTPREKDKLLVAMAANVARRRLERGVKLNHPEAVALITDFVVEGARDGRSVADLMRDGAHGDPPRAGDGGRRRDDPRHPGRGDLSRRHQARHRPQSDPLRSTAMKPGEILPAPGELELNARAAIRSRRGRQHRRPADPGRQPLSFLRDQRCAEVRPQAHQGHAARHRRRHRRALRARPVAHRAAHALLGGAREPRLPGQGLGQARARSPRSARPTKARRASRARPMPACSARRRATRCGWPTPISSSRSRRTTRSTARR